MKLNAVRFRHTLLLQITVFAAALLVPLALTTSPAHAADIEVNGCGAASGISRYVVPNSPLGFGFEGSCNQHDYCYGAGLDKGFCDNQFYDNMHGVCDGNTICNGLAWLYYQAVNKAGTGPYDESAQARLDSLINTIVGCGADDACVQHGVDQANLDGLVQQLQACQGDSACEQSVADRFSDPTPVSDPTPSDPTPVSDQTPVSDPTPVDPTPVDPTPVDPGFGGSDFGGGGGEYPVMMD